MSFAGLGNVPLRARDPMPAGEWLLIDAAVLANAVYFSERARSKREDGIAATEDPQPAVTGPRLYDFACSLLDRFTPSHALAAWDGRKNWRKAAPEAGGIPGYKAARAEKPYGLRALLAVAPDVLDAAGVRSVRIDGFEADDVIASAAANANGGRGGTVIVSNDKDFAQCLAYPPVGRVRWWNPMAALKTDTLGDAAPADRGEWVTAAAVEAKWGVYPWHFTDYQAIAGDASDSVPGCPGIGAVGARDLVQAYGTIARIYEAVARGEAPVAKYAQRLMDGRDSVYQSLRAVTLDTSLFVTAEPVGDRQEIHTLSTRFASPFKRPDVSSLNAATRTAMAPEAEAAPAPAPAPAPAQLPDEVVAEDPPRPESDGDKIRANARAAVELVIRNALAVRQTPEVVLERAKATAANYPTSLAPTEDEILAMIREASRAQMEREQAPEGQRPNRVAAALDAATDAAAAAAASRPKATKDALTDHVAIPERWRGHQRSQLQLHLATQCRNELAVAALSAGHAQVPTGAPSLLRSRLLDEIACIVEVLTGALPWAPVEWPAWTGRAVDEVRPAPEAAPEPQPTAEAAPTASPLDPMAEAWLADSFGPRQAAPEPQPTAEAAPTASLEAAQPTADAPPETAAGDVASQPVAERPRLLFIDCQPRGGEWVELSDLLAPVYRWVEGERKCAHWLTLPFAEGPRLAAAGLAHGLRNGSLSLPERLVVRRSHPGAAEALAELTPHYARDAVVEASR